MYSKKLRVIIDSRALDNFISPRAIKKLNILIKRKVKLYKLIVVDRTLYSNKKVDIETIPTRIIINYYTKKIAIDIILLR